jgi:carboxyl-terminal processing protease
MKKSLIIIQIFLSICYASGQETINSPYRKDFDFFWTSINDDYCYWDKKQTDWNKVKALYAPQADTITSKSSFVQLLEKVLYELYDHHAGLSVNTANSPRLVPTGTDIWAEYVNGVPTITELRPGYGAALAGIKPGMEVISVNDVPVEKAILPFLAKSLRKPDVEAKNYALRILLAGDRSLNRKFTVSHLGKQQDVFPDLPVNLLVKNPERAPLESRVINNTGYIRINNTLGENSLIPLFDSVLLSLKNTKSLILDLRETPSGGNTTVARAILGSFIAKEGFYQKHELTAELSQFGVKRSWMEIVSPREWVYTGPLNILVNHWTGSVAEGITIGFDALARGTSVGTPMAALNGAIYTYTMPNTGIRFSFPVEKLFHIDGTPREFYRPRVQVDMLRSAGLDPILDKALDNLRKLP